jgi:hypothetical protein
MSSVPTAMCWMPSPLYLRRIFLDLALVVGGLVERDADRPHGEVMRARHQAGQLALDVEEVDLLEIEQVAVEVPPLVHVAADDIVGQVVEIIESRALRPGIALAEPVEFGVVGDPLIAPGVDEIEQRSADADDGGTSSVLSSPLYSSALRDGMRQCLPGIDNAPGHGRRAGTVNADEAAANEPFSALRM